MKVNARTEIIRSQERDDSKPIAALQLIERVQGGEPRETRALWSPRERALFELVADGTPWRVASRNLAIEPSQARGFLLRRDVKEALHGERDASLLGELMPQAIRVAREILEDADTPRSVKSKLALGLIEMGRKMSVSDKEDARDMGKLDDLDPEKLERMASLIRQGLAVLDLEHAPKAPQDDAEDLF